MLWLIMGLAVTGCGATASGLVFAPIETDPVNVGTSATSPREVKSVSEPVIARVNGQPILLADYLQQEKQVEVSQTVLHVSASASDQPVQQDVLNALINQTIIDQSARTQGLIVADDVLTRSMGELKNGTTDQAFESWLALNRLTEADLRETLRTELTTAALFAEVAAQMPMSAAQVHARQILLPDLAQAENAYARLRAGESFSVVAQEVSQDPASRLYGGDLGWFPQGVGILPSEAENVAFSLEAGEFSPVIQTEAGYHIIKVELRDENRPLTPEYRLKQQVVLFDLWVREQRASAKIEHYAN